MSSRIPVLITGALTAGCIAGALSLAGAGGSSAAPAHPAPADSVQHAAAHAPAAPAADRDDAEPEGPSVSAPYLPGRPHVPADVQLLLGPGGSADGARYLGPKGSMFNGPVDVVDEAVDAWWAEQMAAGVSPREADRKLAHPQG